MKISPQEKKDLDNRLKNIMECSQRSLVSLRKSDYDNLLFEMTELANSISEFMLEASVQP